MESSSRRALAISLGAAALVAVVYSVLAEPFAVSWGLIAVGLIGGWLIGAPLAGRGRAAVAVIAALGAWLAGIVGAFVLSQLLLPDASSPFAERLSLVRLSEYLRGTVMESALPRLLALVGTVVTAWRSAR